MDVGRNRKWRKSRGKLQYKEDLRKKNRITERRKKRNRCEINRRKKRKHSENECQEIENVGKIEEKAINGIIEEERKNRKK